MARRCDSAERSRLPRPTHSSHRRFPHCTTTATRSWNRRGPDAVAFPLGEVPRLLSRKRWSGSIFLLVEDHDDAHVLSPLGAPGVNRARAARELVAALGIPHARVVVDARGTIHAVPDGAAAAFDGGL